MSPGTCASRRSSVPCRSGRTRCGGTTTGTRGAAHPGLARPMPAGRCRNCASAVSGPPWGHQAPGGRIMRAKNALISGEASWPSSSFSRRRIALSRLVAGGGDIWAGDRRGLGLLARRSLRPVDVGDDRTRLVGGHGLNLPATMATDTHRRSVVALEPDGRDDRSLCRAGATADRRRVQLFACTDM
jgi:hypothetical protein